MPQAVSLSSLEGGDPPRRRLRIVRRWTTSPNAFGLWREYYSEPSFIPDIHRSLSTFQSGNLPLCPSLQEALGPFPNYSTFLQAKWLWQSDTTVLGAAANNRLVEIAYSDPDFRHRDVVGVCFTSLRQKVAEYQPSPFLDSDEWKETAVRISVPLGPQQTGNAFPASADLSVSGLHHRSIVDVVKRVLTTDPNVVHYHLHPFRQYLSTPGSSSEELPKRVVDDIYNSDAMLREYEALRRSPREPGCPFERVILALQFWSDATQLANFGTAKLWPVYMYFGNQPKWARSRPDMHACHDIAHIPSVSNGPLPLWDIDCLLTHSRTGFSSLIHFKILFASKEDFQRMPVSRPIADTSCFTLCGEYCSTKNSSRPTNTVFLLNFQTGLSVECIFASLPILQIIRKSESWFDPPHVLDLTKEL